MRQNKRLSILSVAVSAALILFSANASAISDAEAKQLFDNAYQGNTASLQALQEVQQGAESGDAASEDWYGSYFEFINKDHAQAAQWFRKAADQGETDAQNNLGVLYDNGQGVPQDYAQAAQWFRKAADQWYAQAQNNLGVLYANGQGVPQDYAQAAQWFRKAAAQGNAIAQKNFGVGYYIGQGVAQDYAQAAQWLRYAADQGNADAQSNLGVLYHKGQSVPQNDVIAYALYNLSASKDQSSSNLATSNRDALVHSMSEAQIEAGQALTQKMASNGVTATIDNYLTPRKKIAHQKRKHQ